MIKIALKQWGHREQEPRTLGGCEQDPREASPTKMGLAAKIPDGRRSKYQWESHGISGPEKVRNQILSHYI